MCSRKKKNEEKLIKFGFKVMKEERFNIIVCQSNSWCQIFNFSKVKKLEKKREKKANSKRVCLNVILGKFRIEKLDRFH